MSLTNFNLSEADLKALIDKRYKDRGTEILGMYRKYYPEKSPYLVQAMMLSDAGFRRSRHVGSKHPDPGMGPCSASMCPDLSVKRATATTPRAWPINCLLAGLRSPAPATRTIHAYRPGRPSTPRRARR